jgi:glyceraldehyde 3-phosphate dehydrogenase
MEKRIKVAINGFGRIGRNVFKIAIKNPNITVVAINDLSPPATLAHLLKYDSVHGQFDGTIESTDTSLIVNGVEIKIIANRSPNALPWKSLDVDIVVESTGIFTSATSDRGGYCDHLNAGAKKVILTVPAKDEITTVVLGVNDHVISPEINTYSNASCTTNCLAPIVKVLHDNFGLKRGIMNTVHAFTNDQNILDASHSDLRRARTASHSIIPTSTGAARAVGLVLPDLKGKLDGMAMRVPVPDGSVIDLTCELEKPATKASINAAMKYAANESMRGILEYTEDPIVSADIIGNPHSSIFDSLLTMVLNDTLIKVVSWYDNEMGYSNRVVDLIQKII